MSTRDRYRYSPCTPSQADIQEELENMIERQGKKIDELSKKLDIFIKKLELFNSHEMGESKVNT